MNRREMELSIEEPVPLIDLIRSRSYLSPLVNHLETLEVAVNREVSDVETRVGEGGEFAFLLP